MMFDVKRIAALEGLAHRLHDLGDGGRPAEECRLSHAVGAVVGGDPDVARPAGKDRLDRLDPHVSGSWAG